MATRFRLTADATAPDVSPALQSYTHTQTSRRKLLTSDASALATSAYTPDGSDHLAAGDAHHVQFVSDPLPAGVVFTSGNAIKYAVQALEANGGNNLFVQLYVAVVDSTGGTVRRVLRSKVADATELATSLTSRTLSTTQSGASYTTVDGDRLVVEFSVTGTPTSAGQTQGHNASLRWGSDGAGGDLLENDTQTATDLNGWIEVAPTIVTPVTLSIGNAAHAQASQTLSLSQVHELTIAPATQASSSPQMSLTESTSLVIASALHAQDVAQVSETQVHQLAVQGAVQAQTAQGVGLTQVHSLAVSDAAQGQAVDALGLAQVHELALSSAAHEQAAGSLSLGQVHELAVQPAEQAEASTDIELGVVVDLVVQDAEQSQAADGLPLAQQHQLSAQDAAHEQVVDEVALSGGSVVHQLTIDSAGHVQIAEGPGLEQQHLIVVASAVHSLWSSGIVFSGFYRYHLHRRYSASVDLVHRTEEGGQCDARGQHAGGSWHVAWWDGAGGMVSVDWCDLHLQEDLREGVA